MDLNGAMDVARTGLSVRCDATMRPDWTVRYIPEEGLFYYFRPSGEKAHKIIFTDAHRASFQWQVS